jgi:ankyrin repeat protein
MRNRKEAPSDNKDDGVGVMIKKYSAMVKETDHRYMDLDEKNTPRAKLLKTLIQIQKEDEKTIQQVEQFISEIKKNGGDLNYYSITGATPISISCIKNKPGILKLLIEEKADYHFTHSPLIPPFCYFSPHTNLMLATMSHSIKCMKILIDVGASPSEENQSSNTGPLHMAAEKGFIEEMKLLISAKANINPDCNSPLNMAVEAGQLEAVNLLISSKANINHAEKYFDNFLIHNAASGGHIEIMKSLIEANADINVKNGMKKTALILAIDGYYKTRSKNHELAIRYLIDLGAEPKFTSYPVTTDIFTTKSIFTQLKKHSSFDIKPMENSLAACEINKGIPDILFNLCMLISEYLDPHFFKQDVLAEERSQRMKGYCKSNLVISGVAGVAWASFIFLMGRFGTEQEKAELFSSKDSLGYESFKAGLLVSAGFFIIKTAADLGEEYGVFDRLKKILNNQECRLRPK